MRRDEKGLKDAAFWHYKYVLANDNGTITDMADTRKTLEKHVDEHNVLSGNKVYTIRQYMKATEGGEE